MKIAAIHLGHSHIAAMVPYLYNRPYPEKTKPNDVLHFIFDTKKDNVYALDDTRFEYSNYVNNKNVINPRIEHYINNRVDGDAKQVYFCQFGGNSHNVYLLLQQKKFDFVLPSHPDLPLIKDAEIIPYGVIEAVLKKDAEGYLANMDAVRNSFPDNDIYAIISPPPIYDDTKVLEVVNYDGFFERFPNKVVNPYSLRLKGWLLQTQLYASLAKKIGIKLIYPSDFLSNDGLSMPKDYIGNDPTHGNVEYGGAVLRNIEDTLNGDFAGWGWLQEGA